MTDAEKLKEALEALVIKVEAMMPHLNSIRKIAHVHGFPYDGPTLEKELAQSKQLLKDLTGDN